MARDPLLATIQEIQALFPPDLVTGFWLERVDRDNLDELLARALDTFIPAFLPVFQRYGDLYALHLRPENLWPESAWVQLPHDAASPVLVATHLCYLPAGLITPPHALPKQLEAIWPGLALLVARIPGAAMPERAPFAEPYADLTALRAKYDPLDGAAQMAAALAEAGFSDEAAVIAVEATLEGFPCDPHVLSAAAIVRQELGYADPAPLAVRVLERELPTGFRHATGWFYADSGLELLELIRPLAAPRIDDDSPLAPLREASYFDQDTAEVLHEIAGRLHKIGEADEIALSQLRNGASVAALYGHGLDSAWCRALAEAAHQVVPGCLAAQVAERAAEVIHRGP